MTSEQRVKPAYRLAIVLFIIGVFSYAAFSAPTPDRPVRLMFKTSAGKVLFDHQTHTDTSGFGISCGDCHHTLEPDEYADAQSCSECHDEEAGDEEVPKRADAFHQQCIGCHEAFDVGPNECSSCHVM